MTPPAIIQRTQSGYECRLLLRRVQIMNFGKHKHKHKKINRVLENKKLKTEKKLLTLSRFKLVKFLITYISQNKNGMH